MKILMTILGALLLSSTCFAQQLKTYNGEYDLRSYEVDVLGINPGLLNGTATYSYYENEDLKRIRSGKFNYTGKFSRNGGSVTASISGNYSENNKDGKWSVNQSVEMPEVRQPGRVSTPASSVKLNFAGIYKDGLPNGLWTSTLSVTQKGKTITGTHTLNFSKNVIIGNFKETTNDGTDNSISGTLDNNGYFTGKTIVKKDGREYQLTFNNGLLVSSIGRSIQSGNIFENFKISEDELTIFNQLLNEKDSTVIDEIPFKIVDGNNYEIDKLISNEFINIMKSGSLFDVTPGDLSIDENKKYNWIGFKIRVLEKSETKTEKLTRLKAEEEKLQRAEEERIARLKAEEINNLNSKAWESLLKKDYSNAIIFCKKGIELDDDNLYLKGNLAHGYLLNGDFEKAREIYLAYLGSSLDNQTTWLKMIEVDFAEFNSKGINSEDMSRILYEVWMNKEERKNYALLSENERYEQFKKNKKKGQLNKFLKDVISN